MLIYKRLLIIAQEHSIFMVTYDQHGSTLYDCDFSNKPITLVDF